MNNGIAYGNLPEGNVNVIYDFVYQIHLIACSKNVSGVRGSQSVQLNMPLVLYLFMNQ